MHYCIDKTISKEWITMHEKSVLQKYGDIIELPHHVSSNHPQMSNSQRAAQFSSFAALTGHNAAIQETARLTDKKIELDEYEQNELNRKLAWLQKRLHDDPANKPTVQITYFQPDERKTGGAYVTIAGEVKRILEAEQTVLLTDGQTIPIGDILEIEEISG